jgi:hypothetical protein
MNQSEDLWQITKLVKQRYGRTKDDYQKELAWLAYQSMKLVREDPSIENAEEFFDTEQDFLFHPNTRRNTVSYSERVLEAVKSNNYNYDSRPNINYAGNEKNTPDLGYVYVARSDTKPNQIKIGYTTMKLEKRMQTYKTRYGYSINITAYAFVYLPNKFEIELHRALTELRVSGLERNDSNEWFYGDEELVIGWIKYIAIRDNLSIFRNSWDD